MAADPWLVADPWGGPHTRSRSQWQLASEAGPSDACVTLAVAPRHRPASQIATDLLHSVVAAQGSRHVVAACISALWRLEHACSIDGTTQPLPTPAEDVELRDRLATISIPLQAQIAAGGRAHSAHGLVATEARIRANCAKHQFHHEKPSSEVTVADIRREQRTSSTKSSTAALLRVPDPFEWDTLPRVESEARRETEPDDNQKIIEEDIAAKASSANEERMQKCQGAHDCIQIGSATLDAKLERLSVMVEGLAQQLELATAGLTVTANRELERTQDCSSLSKLSCAGLDTVDVLQINAVTSEEPEVPPVVDMRVATSLLCTAIAHRAAARSEARHARTITKRIVHKALLRVQQRERSRAPYELDGDVPGLAVQDAKAASGDTEGRAPAAVPCAVPLAVDLRGFWRSAEYPGDVTYEVTLFRRMRAPRHYLIDLAEDDECCYQVRYANDRLYFDCGDIWARSAKKQSHQNPLCFT